MKVRNWWTKSNLNLPLCRFTGCKLKLYKSENVDYVCSYFNCYPMVDTLHLRNSCQPSIQLMNPDSIIVPSKRTQPKGRPYKTIKITPPAQLQSKWYFTKDIATTGLLLLTTTICSLDHYFIASNAENNNVGFKSLNTKYINKHNFGSTSEYGWVPWIEGTTQKTFWVHKSAHPNRADISTLYVYDCIYLGNASTYQPGRTPTQSETMTQYLENYKNWGNLFYHTYLHGEALILVCTKNFTEIKNFTRSSLTNATNGFTILTEPIYLYCRYSPDIDTGIGNLTYLLPSIRDTNNWEPQNNENLKHGGFPLWITFFGWLDWIRKGKFVVHVDDFYTVVFKSQFITPKLDYYCPIDEDFYNNKSPYQQNEGEIVPSDHSNWNPHVRFQQQTLENIVQAGPGTAKFPHGTKSVEAKCKFSFYFKFGGCPPKMETITDPTKQEKFPIPHNEQSMYPLQNPSQPPETFLYNFDVRKDIITKTAAKRIKSDWQTETTLLSTAGKWSPEILCTDESTKTSSEEEEDSENEEATLLHQLNRYRRKRKRLQYKLLSLIQQE